MKLKHRSLLSPKQQQKSQHFFKSKEVYEKQLFEVQQRLIQLQHRLHSNHAKVIILFEGPDAAGKGGTIKRLTRYMDPRGAQVHAIGAPNVIEAQENYWQRFFKKVPLPGTCAIFDRSWYGRVLVERVEKLIPKTDWARAYSEINHIEAMFRADGILVLKYFLDLSYAEQKERFKARQTDPLQSWKLTDDDWRNRKQWDTYYEAFEEMIKKTSTAEIPWKVIAADSKWSARVEILEDIAHRLEKFLHKQKK